MMYGDQVPGNEEGESGRVVLSGVAYSDAGEVCVLTGATGTGVALSGGEGGGKGVAFWTCAGDPVSSKGSSTA